MAHVDSLLPLDRRDLEFIWLLTAGFDDANLRPSRPAVRRLFLIDTVGDPLQRLALRLGASAAGFELLDVPDSLDADAVLGTIGPVADAIALADDSGRFGVLYEQDELPVLTVQRAGGGPLEVLAHLYRWYMAGRPLQGLRVVWQGTSPATLQAWCEVTRQVPLQVTHVGARDEAPPGLLEDLREAGQRGEFRRLRTAPDHDVDATARPDLRTLACTIAAVLEFTQP